MTFFLFSTTIIRFKPWTRSAANQTALLRDGKFPKIYHIVRQTTVAYPLFFPPCRPTAFMDACDFRFVFLSPHAAADTYVVTIARDHLLSFVSHNAPQQTLIPLILPHSLRLENVFPPLLLRSGNASAAVRFILCRRGLGEPYKTSGTDSHPPHTHPCPSRPVFKASVQRPPLGPYLGTYRVVFFISHGFVRSNRLGQL